MNKLDLLVGLIIGFIGTFIGCFIFITFFTQYDFITGINIMKLQSHLGKLITLGSIMDLIIFGFLLKINKEFMARGVLLSVILMTILTLFI
jgi:hypothetical protein